MATEVFVFVCEGVCAKSCWQVCHCMSSMQQTTDLLGASGNQTTIVVQITRVSLRSTCVGSTEHSETASNKLTTQRDVKPNAGDPAAGGTPTVPNKKKDNPPRDLVASGRPRSNQLKRKMKVFFGSTFSQCSSNTRVHLLGARGVQMRSNGLLRLPRVSCCAMRGAVGPWHACMFAGGVPRAT